MQRHDGSLRQHEPVLYVEFEYLMFGGRLSAIAFEHDVDGRQSLAVLIDDLSAEFEHECGAGSAQGVSRTFERVFWWRRRTQKRVQHSRCADFALKRSTLDGRLEVARAEVVQHSDEFIAAEIGRVSHRWSPVPVANACVLVNQFWMFDDKLAHGFDVVTPDGIDEIAALDQARPTCGSIAACECKLNLCEFHLRWICNRVRMKLIELTDCCCIALSNAAQQVFRLMFELVQVRTNR